MMEDLTNAIKVIQNSAIAPKDRVVTNGDSTFGVNDRGEFITLSSAQGPLELNTLSGMADYIKSNLDLVEQPSYLLQVEDECNVALKTPLINGQRRTLARATASIPRIVLNDFIDVEYLVVMLQANFEDTNDKETILQVVGNIKEETVKQVGDDGVSQAVKIKSGISTVTDVKVPNPVTLAPYRTFTEVKQQPRSAFVFRMTSGPRGKLIEADGGKWRSTAIKSISEFFEKELAELISSKKIILIA